MPVLDDLEARKTVPGDVGVRFEAVVGTADGQVAIAPGALRRSWSQDGRRYFHYASDTPIRERVQFFSGKYAVRRQQCHGVDVEVFHHPTHGGVVGAMVRSACASLGLYNHLYGPYAHRTLRIVENSMRDIGAHSEPSLVDYGDGFSMLDPAREPGGLDLVSAVTAHEVAHQWWGGTRLAPARVEGAGFLIESMATYSATQVLEATLGRDQMHAYLDMMRHQYQVPRSRAMAPLLRATEEFLNYRKGPLAMYALSQYIGRDKVNLALRRLLDAHPPGSAALATSLDLYRELTAVTPVQYQAVLHDLLAANMYWEFSAKQAKARKVGDLWEVTVDLRSRKLLVDDAGAEVDRPLDEWVEIGVYPGPARRQENGEVMLGKPMYLKKHRVTRTQQSITLKVATEPGHVGIDPRALLIEMMRRDNFVEVARVGEPVAR